MNILTDDLPESVDISGVMYQINTDFRTCLKTIMAFEDPELTPQEKSSLLLSNLYPEIPSDIKQAMAQANLFLNGGKVNDDENESEPHCGCTASAKMQTLFLPHFVKLTALICNKRTSIGGSFSPYLWI